MTASFEIRHAGLIALRVAGRWTGALIEGASGSGKSDLALRALAQDFRLVADDRVIAFASAGRLFGRAPRVLAGLIEQRGLGVVTESALPLAQVALKVRCNKPGADIDRLPDVGGEIILGIEIPVLDFCPFEFSAPAKIRRALEHLGAGRGRAYQDFCAPAG
jgi:serine kinase of HPr protein (carbohydrate metabolism regulator)